MKTNLCSAAWKWDRDENASCKANQDIQEAERGEIIQPGLKSRDWVCLDLTWVTFVDILLIVIKKILIISQLLYFIEEDYGHWKKEKNFNFNLIQCQSTINDQTFLCVYVSYVVSMWRRSLFCFFLSGICKPALHPPWTPVSSLPGSFDLPDGA